MTSTTPSPEVQTPLGALFSSLVDDAAIFPPGLTPWPDAVARHPHHHSAWYGGLIGPLLLGVTLIDELEHHPFSVPLNVGVIARPGVAPVVVADAVRRFRALPHLTVAMVDMAHTPTWREALQWEVPLALEVLAADRWEDGVDDLVAARAEHPGRDLRAKLRTGATETIAWPTPDVVAAFIARCVQAEVPFKLTGGMHHAVRHTAADGEQYGFLNVLAATSIAVGSTTPDPHVLVRWLEERSADSLRAHLSALDLDTARRTRDFFTSFGCCDVTDPVQDLVTLAYLAEGTPLR